MAKISENSAFSCSDSFDRTTPVQTSDVSYVSALSCEFPPILTASAVCVYLDAIDQLHLLSSLRCYCSFGQTYSTVSSVHGSTLNRRRLDSDTNQIHILVRAFFGFFSCCGRESCCSTQVIPAQTELRIIYILSSPSPQLHFTPPTASPLLPPS